MQGYVHYVVLTTLLALTALSVMAQTHSGHHGHHQHHDKAAQPAATSPQPHADDHGSHRHDSWITPPQEYARFRSQRWADLEAVQRGQVLFQMHCQTCHGADGKGAGPGARGLPHPPADLNQHFHRQPGDGDAYLFWRVSEGGTVEPFKSMQSTMPAFKTLLNEEQRWDVLAYVHVYFHLGLAHW